MLIEPEINQNLLTKELNVKKLHTKVITLMIVRLKKHEVLLINDKYVYVVISSLILILFKYIQQQISITTFLNSFIRLVSVLVEFDSGVRVELAVIRFGVLQTILEYDISSHKQLLKNLCES